MPDYSHFQSEFPKHARLGIAAVKVESHQHKEDGGWHLKIDVRLGPHQEIYMEALKNGFHAMMKELSPVDPIYEENYSGEEANREADRSIEDYYRESQRRFTDPWRSN